MTGLSAGGAPALRPIPGVAGAACGTARAARLAELASPPRTPPMIGEVRAVGLSRVRGARGRSLASAVPSQRRQSVSRKPPKRRLRPRAALRETSESGANALRWR
jgi:hypothetical protein